jgi:hypothetical protein
VDVDAADVERSTVKGGSLQYLYDRPDRVVLAKVMIEP